MVLDENIQNYYADVESIAFDPGVTVPGMPAQYHDCTLHDLLLTMARVWSFAMSAVDSQTVVVCRNCREQ